MHNPFFRLATAFAFYVSLPRFAFSQTVEIFLNASNANSQEEQRVMSSLVDSPWLKVLGFAVDVPACGALCVAYRDVAAAASRCTGFTRVVAPNGSQPNCFGNADGSWLPMPSPGNNEPHGPHLFDAGRVSWPCESTLNCSLNGACTNGACVCTMGWTGARCGSLDLLPVDRSVLGFNPMRDGRNMSSWGGSVVAVNGTWHMYASRFDNHCGVNSYLLNSRVVHAESSSSALGPYTEVDSVLDAFAHEPAVARAPDGRLALITVHGPLNGFAECQCIDGSTVRGCGCNNSCHPAQPVLSISASPYGPWNSTQVPPPVGPNSTAGHMENPSIWINEKTGELWGMSRGGGVSVYASNWSDYATWTHVTDSVLSGSPDVEDPVMWMDDSGNFHALTHLLQGPHFCYGILCFVGVHQYSLDGINWLFGGVAYTNNVSFIDGSSILLTRRERPHIVFAESSRSIVALSNSAMVGGGFGDRSFTLVQGVRLSP